MKEGNISRLILIEASKRGHRLFINARGRGWVGGRQVVSGNTVTLTGAAQVTFGVGPNGAGDLLGWTKGGRFASVEVKKPGEHPREDQIAWRQAVLAAGGVAGVAHTVDEAIAILEPFM